MTNQENQVFEDEIDLRELFEVLWTNKVRIIVITGLISLSSIVISLMMTNYYTSESVLIARDQQDSALPPVLQSTSCTQTALAPLSKTLNSSRNVIKIKKYTG